MGQPMKMGVYLVMDNAPIHGNEKIEALIKGKGYNCVYLPPYSSELNPIEQFWAFVKNLVKRGRLLDNETLTQRITEACLQVTKKDLAGFIGHSTGRIDDCLNKLLL
ncbi:hypothetical protein G6F42_021010 [Rhizopus arrhizus]|nr:hypothetical protein G6F42_021010 [Rhizopus arrhizus]